MTKYMIGTTVQVFPSSKQQKIIRINSDTARWYYNHFVALSKEQWQLKKELFRLNDLLLHTGITFNQRILDIQSRIERIQYLTYNPTEIKNNYYWLRFKEIDSINPQQTLRQYKKAWNMYHKVHNSGVPNFHKKSFKQNYHTAGNGIKIIDNKHLQLPKIGIIRCSNLRKKLLQHKDLHVLNATIKCTTDGVYTVSLQLSSAKAFFRKKRLHKRDTAIGIDLNLDNFYTDSNGKVIDNPRYYRKAHKRLKKLQRTFNRRYRKAVMHKRRTQTKNVDKARKEVARISRHVANQRKNFVHNLSIDLIKNHDLIVTEELRSKNMLKNHALAMSISDVGWRQFISFLQYKADAYGKKVITVNPKYTTQVCSSCGMLLSEDKRLKLQDREWTCPECGAFHIRDHNAAINILNKGLQHI